MPMNPRQRSEVAEALEHLLQLARTGRLDSLHVDAVIRTPTDYDRTTLAALQHVGEAKPAQKGAPA